MTEQPIRSPIRSAIVSPLDFGAHPSGPVGPVVPVFLLLEDGSFVLLEDGSKIELER